MGADELYLPSECLQVFCLGYVIQVSPIGGRRVSKARGPIKGHTK